MFFISLFPKPTKTVNGLCECVSKASVKSYYSKRWLLCYAIVNYIKHTYNFIISVLIIIQVTNSMSKMTIKASFGW